MNVTLRGMQPSDLQPIAELAQQAFKDMYPFDWLSNAQALLAGCETGKVFVGVAEAQREVAGYCNLRAWPGGGWIDQIVVTAEHQRKGIGRQLLEYVLTEAMRRGFWKVSLIVSETERGTLAFFESYGFRAEGIMKDQIRKGTSGVLLSYVTDYGLHPNQ
ncbi:GNAT family N-acetyltransferase [Aquisalimonas sp.]|uniref:GNAT family N-acetyltransferase n=1 Tax=Aquisalimonas sp. TaxID=1872621 RepID=UPI0025BFE724|nr:GNAT family N-acetyltransferase [Aquisalimonas sp.]